MNASRFDAVARTLATGASRRRLLGALLGGLVAGRLQPTRAQTPATASPVATPAASPVPSSATPAVAAGVCANPDRTGLQDRAPGDLVAYEELAGAETTNMPAGARAWRVVYVSTGRDNTERTLVCGVVVAPAAGPTLVTGPDGEQRGRVVAWSHGTDGLETRCQPAHDPAGRVFGPTPAGINLVAWSNNADGTGPQGTVEDGILAGMVGAGWIVTVTDYYADLWGDGTLESFIMGKIEAANGIDLVRAADHLMAATGLPTGAAYDVVTWGHSQGGHAALWMGQLLEPYASATRTADGPTLSLAGAVLEAPASVFIAQPGDPDIALGDGLFDWFINPTRPSFAEATGIDLMVAQVFAAWSRAAAGGVPNPDAMPAYPAGALDLAAVTSPAGRDLIMPLAELCWTQIDEVASVVAPIGEDSVVAAAVRNGPTIDGQPHGNFDHLCAGDPAPALAAWCDWLRFNTPGPRGVSPLPKLPRRGDALAPVLIAAGSSDAVVHCLAPASAPDAVPPGGDCVPAALYAALAADYCPDGAAAGHLALSIWRAEPGVTEAGHEDIAGMLAAADLATPRFAGSPLQRFIVAAFDGTLAPGCAATVVNRAGAR